MKHQIKNRYNESIIVYECDLPDSTTNAMRAALVKAAAERADLGGAELRWANLRGADLRGANLSGADLRGANLSGANLRGADLSGADLYGADLGGANLGGAELGGAELRWANLYGANLGDKGGLVGARPYFSIGPIGSRDDTLTLWITDQGPRLKTGCFNLGTFDEFRANLERDHAEDSSHRKEYEAALLMCEAHAVLWTPETVLVAGGAR